jgi:cytochrome c-type biogenesis protein CcmH/NrfF
MIQRTALEQEAVERDIMRIFCDSYGTKYVSYDVPLAMKTVFLLALFGDEFTSPYITVN